MLNTVCSNNQKVNLNAVSGTLVKSHPKSFFQACHQKSELANTYFGSRSKYVVLQVMCLSESWLMFECLDKNLYDPDISVQVLS